ncbi:MAG: DMT family transporter [Candidatus Longimicrobiales bacterium M2_2A_002]
MTGGSREPRAAGGADPMAGIIAPPGLILLVAVLAMSWGGPLVRYATAPALAVAGWRVAFSVLFIAVVVLLRDRGRAIRRLSGRDWALAALSGAFLAGHFWSWIASLSYTTVASSVVLVNTQPVFVALLSIAFLGERPTRRQWAGIGVAVAGAGVIGWGDFAGGTEPLLGDLLAVAGAVFVSLYYVIGRRLRQRLALWDYIAVVYGVAALILLGATALFPDVDVTGYPATDWLVFLALAAGPMMIGHTGVNYALRYVPAYVANLTLLGEPIGATLLAWWLPGIREEPTAQLIVGGTLVLLGIGLGVIRRRATGD